MWRHDKETHRRFWPLRSAWTPDDTAEVLAAGSALGGGLWGTSWGASQNAYSSAVTMRAINGAGVLETESGTGGSL